MTLSRTCQIAACWAVFAVPSAALADGSVSGVLFDAEGMPASGMVVTVEGASARTATDEDGAFSLVLPAGTWTVTVRGPGLEAPAQAEVPVTDGQVTEVLGTVTSGRLAGVAIEAPPDSGPVDASPVAGATGTLSGEVVDDEGQPIAGARVFVRGQAVEGVTNAAGRFTLALPPGTHTVSVLQRGYAPQTVSGLVVEDGGTTPARVELVAAGVELEAFVVLAPAIEGGTATLLAERQNTSDVVDTVSAEEMSRRGDSSAASALKRVTGLTVVGGKYIYVRGMGERYSATLLNGATLPSPEPTRRVVPLDLFPTAMLESVVVQKTFSASMPADFGGGVLQLRTRGIPDEPVLKFGVSTTYTSGTTGEMSPFGPAVSGDFWGNGTDGRRLNQEFVQATEDTPLVIKSALPGSVGFTAEEIEELSKSTPNRWGLQDVQVPYDLGLNASIGNGWDIGEEGRVGALVGVTFDNSWERRLYTERYPNLQSGELQVQNSYDFEDLSNLVQLGAMGVLEARFTEHHSVRSTTFSVRDSEYLGRRYTGPNEDIANNIQVERTQWVAREMMVQQFVGEHRFPRLLNAFINWRWTWSEASRAEPDRRDIILEETAEGDYRLRTQGGGAGLVYGNLNDSNIDVGGDVGFDLGDRDDASAWSATIQGGRAITERSRAVNVRRFAYNLRTTPGESDLSFLDDAPSEIFAEDNISVDTGFILAETTAATDHSTGFHRIEANYAQVEARAPTGTSVQLGVRQESSLQSVRTFTLHQEPPEEIIGLVDTTDNLPAATLTQKLPLSVPGTMQVRAGYGRTVNRPSLRELSPAVYFGVVGGREVSGDENTKRALIDNYDLRWEWYLSGNESVSVGWFSKAFQDPIETNILRGAAAREVPVNAKGATNVGWELDLRKSLGFDSGTGWDDLILSGNASFIRSEVDLGDTGGAQTSTERALQGQSPWVYNVQLSYEPVEFPVWGTVLYNAAGASIVEVGTNGLPDTLETPARLLDAVVGWNISPGWALKVKASNVLDSHTVREVGSMTVRDVRAGRAYGLGVSWKYVPKDQR